MSTFIASVITDCLDSIAARRPLCGVPLCEVCLQPFTSDDLEDGVTITSDCCERAGLCSECRQRGNHDCA